jgi:hypothetical protein
MGEILAWQDFPPRRRSHKEGFRHQAYKLLQLLLVFVMSSLYLQLLARIVQKPIHARVVLLPLARVKGCAVNCT